MQDKESKVVEVETEDSIPEHVRLVAELSLSVSEPGQIKARVFHLLGGSAVFGMILGEIDDSFMVGLPCQLVSENGKVNGKPFARGKVIRLVRNSVSFVTIPDGEHKAYYFKWLQKQFVNLPSFFSQERRDIVNDFVYAYDNRNNVKVEQVEDSESDALEPEENNALGSGDNFWSPYQSTEFH